MKQRLIDATSLRRRILKASMPEPFGVERTEDIMLIDSEPTVDPVKRAHWIRVARSENEYWQCSNCHGYFTLPIPKYRGFYMRYCGACGAKMDEEENESDRCR